MFPQGVNARNLQMAEYFDSIQVFRNTFEMPRASQN